MQISTASSAEPGVSLGRVDGVDARQVLEHFHASGHLAEGRAHTVSVRAVREAFGRRWDDRKSLVWDLTEGHIEKRLGEHDFFARISDDEFLIVTPNLSPAVARAMLVGVLRETFGHFLGDASHADLRIMVASGFDEGQLLCRPLSDSELTEALQGGVAEESPAGPGSLAWQAEDVLRPDEAELIAFGGRRLRFSSSVEPIIDLRQWAVTGHRIEPKIMFEDSRLPLSPSALNELLPHDIQTIDLATLRRGILRLAGGESTASKPSLILTVSFVTLSNTRARMALIAAASEHREAMSKAVIWEVTGFDAGLPPSRMKEAVSMIAPFGRSVFARAQTSAFQIHKPKESGIAGLVYQPPVTYFRDEDAALWLLSTGLKAKGRSPTLIAANLSGKALLPMAAAAGFTHATVSG